ncbi:MAG: hypothetical protein M3Q39_10100, partial [Actinomycetota bacterium]|nr:hypothetical protein [Actinomycetota bacterium]
MISEANAIRTYPGLAQLATIRGAGWHFLPVINDGRLDGAVGARGGLIWQRTGSAAALLELPAADENREGYRHALRHRSQPGAVTDRRRSQRSGARTWITDAADIDTRHRHGVPWWAARIPPRWHTCRPQTVQLHRDRGVLTGTFHCACGAVT